MKIICWNCKTVIELDETAIQAAIAKMDETKLNFYDAPCSCGKVNRTPRSVLTGLTPAAPGTQGKVVTRSLRIREDHNTSCDVVGGLVYGQIVDVYEIWSDGKNKWARIGEGMWSAIEYNGEKLMEIIESK